VHVARALDDRLEPNCETMLLAQGDVVLLLVRGVLTPQHLQWVDGPSPRTIEADLATATMSKTRALMYRELFFHVRGVLPHMQPAAVNSADAVAQASMRRWFRAADRTSLHGVDYQRVRAALSSYLFTLRSTVTEHLRTFWIDENAIAEKDVLGTGRRVSIERTQKAAQRLEGALGLYSATRATVGQLLRGHDAVLARRRYTPLSPAETLVTLRIYNERLDAPL
jgi:hypothetical protein